MKIIIAESPTITSDNRHLCLFPSRFTTTENSDKENYYPYELGYLSSLLKKRTEHDITFVSGEGLNASHFLEIVIKQQPNWIVFETSSMTIQQDMWIAEGLKEEMGTKIVFTGQHPTAMPEEVLKVADYVCMGEYEETVLELLQGKDPRNILGLYPNSLRPPIDINMLPWPEDEDIHRINYVTGISSNYKEIQVYASRGCPFKCSFCVCGNLYYSRPNWRPREVRDIIMEIKYLKDKYPQMEGIFFNEEVHNLKKDFVLRLTKEIKANKMEDLHFEAMCMYRHLDWETMRAMYEAGYYMVRIGIESFDELTHKSVGGKGVVFGELISVLGGAKDIGLNIYATFTFGAPGSTKEGDRKTIQLMKRLLQDGLIYRAQISISTPQPGTPFYKWADKNGYLITKDWSRYDGLRCSVVDFPNYSHEEIEENFRLAGAVKCVVSENREIQEAGMMNIIRKKILKDGFIETLRSGIWKIKREIEIRTKLRGIDGI